MTDAVLDHWALTIFGHALCDGKNTLEHSDEVDNNKYKLPWSGNAIPATRKFTNSSSKLILRSKVHVEEKHEHECSDVHVVVFVEG